jgi:hypothetical protein
MDFSDDIRYTFPRYSSLDTLPLTLDTLSLVTLCDYALRIREYRGHYYDADYRQQFLSHKTPRFSFLNCAVVRLPPETSSAEAAEPASTKPLTTKATTTEAITAKQTAATPKPMEVIEATMPAAQASETGVAAAESAR